MRKHAGKGGAIGVRCSAHGLEIVKGSLLVPIAYEAVARIEVQ